MILHYKNLVINPNNIKCKKSMSYSDDYTFVPLRYNAKHIIIQTPALYIPFGIQTSYKNKSVDLSFPNESDFIDTCLLPFYEKVKDRYPTHNVEPFIRESNYSQWMRFKLSNKCSHFNDMKQSIDIIPEKVFGSFIINLTGIWVLKNNIYFQWKLLQSKIYQPIELHTYAFSLG